MHQHTRQQLPKINTMSNYIVTTEYINTTLNTIQVQEKRMNDVQLLALISGLMKQGETISINLAVGGRKQYTDAVVKVKGLQLEE